MNQLIKQLSKLSKNKSFISWRKGVSKNAQEQIDGLFQLSIQKAYQMLQEYSDMVAFGYSIGIGDNGAKFHIINGDNTDDTFPPNSIIIEKLKNEFKSNLNELSAIAIAYRVKLPKGSDAIIIECEHRDGIALQIIVPYQIKTLAKSSVDIITDSAVTIQIDKFIWG